MAITKKHERLAAHEMERGLICQGTTVSYWAYGGSTISALGAGRSIPYNSIDIKTMNDVLTAAEIDGAAFNQIPNQKMIAANLNSWTGDGRYIGLDTVLYWMFGYEDAGSSPQSLGSSIYSHLFELDMYERELAEYRTAEKTFASPGSRGLDRKNRYMTIGIKEGPADHRYPFILCNGFGFTSKAGESLKWDAKGVAYKEDRGTYLTSATFGTGVAGSANKIMHHHLNLSYGPAGALVDLAVTDFSVKCDIPLMAEQDSESGVYIAEPAMNGKYNITLSITLARHSVDTYMAYKDSFTAGCLKAVWTSGSYEFGLYLPDVRISDGAPSGDNVARFPITFECGQEPVAGNPFATEIGSHTLIQKGPLFCKIKNLNSVNEMRRV